MMGIICLTLAAGTTPTGEVFDRGLDVGSGSLFVAVGAR